MLRHQTQSSVAGLGPYRQRFLETSLKAFGAATITICMAMTILGMGAFECQQQPQMPFPRGQHLKASSAWEDNKPVAMGEIGTGP